MDYPATFREQLEDAANGAGPSAAAAQHLLRSGGLPSARAQAGYCKGLLAALEPAAGHADAAECERIARLLAALLLLPGSKPLHRPLLSWAAHLPQGPQTAVGRCLAAALSRELPRDNAPFTTAEVAATGREAHVARSAAGLPPGHVVQVAGSVMSAPNAPQLRAWLAPVSAPLLMALGAGALDALAAAGAGGGLAPQDMEALVDALAVSYALLQAHGPDLAAAAAAGAAPAAAFPCELPRAAAELRAATAGEAVDAVAVTALAMLRALQGGVLLRETLVTAAVVLWAAAALPPASSTEVAALFARALLPGQWPPDAGAARGAPSGALHAWAAPRGVDLALELRRLSPIGRVCALKGLCSRVPVQTVCADLLCAGSGAGGAPAAPREEGGVSGGPWVLLTDGLLPAVCAEVAAAPDQHHKYHAVCALHHCLARLKPAWAALAAQQEQQQLREGVCGTGCGAAPPTAAADGAPTMLPPWLLPEQRDAVLHVLWASLQEPLQQTVNKVEEAFRALLEALTLQGAAAADLGLTPPPGASAADADAFVAAAVAPLLAMPPTRKARYMPLAVLLPHVGAGRLLELQPDLVRQTLSAMSDVLAAHGASLFFKALLDALRREDGGGAAAAAAAKGSRDAATAAAACARWLPPLLAALCGPNERLRTAVAAHALPAALALAPEALPLLLDGILAAEARAASQPPQPAGPPPAAADASGSLEVPDAAAALVVALTAAKLAKLVPSLDALPAGRGSGVRRLLLRAVACASPAVRTQTLELACVSGRSTQAPCATDLLLVSSWLALGMRNTATEGANKALAAVRKLLARQRASVYALTRSASGAAAGPASRAAAGKAASKRGAAAPSAAAGGDGSECEDAVVARQERWLQETMRQLLDSLYPGAPSARQHLALHLLGDMLEEWRDADWAAAPPDAAATATASKGTAAGEPAAAAQRRRAPPRAPFQPFCDTLLSWETVQALLDVLASPWDRLRACAHRVLLLLPAPLPGLTAPQQLLPPLAWACHLLRSPRQHDADAGARLLCVLFQKYALRLRWRLRVAPQLEVACADDSGEPAARGAADEGWQAPALGFVGSLTDLVASQLGEARGDLPTACRQGLLHGSLLTVRHCLAAVPWQHLAAPPPAGDAAAVELCERWRRWLAVLLALLSATASVVLPRLAAQDQHNSAEDVDEFSDGGAAEDCGDGGGGASYPAHRADVAECEGEATNDVGAEEGVYAGGVAPTAQVVLSAVWTSAKEVSLVVAALAALVPLPPPDWPPAATAPGGGGRRALEDGALPFGAAGAAGGAVPLVGAAARLAAAAAPLTGGGDAAPAPAPAPLLDVEQWQGMGELLLQMTVATKHAGALIMLSTGLQAVARQLLISSHPALRALPSAWLRAVLGWALRPGQGLDDVVRRSGGVPVALAALFLSEPIATTRTLLPHGMAALLRLAAGDAAAAEAFARGEGALAPPSPAELAPAAAADEQLLSSCWPRVHALNALRAAFNDARLSVDVSGLVAQGVEVAVTGMASPHWEVRNAASLVFSALLVRVAGHRNAGGAHSSRRGPTADDLFLRYPPLHAFLLAQLREAAEQLGDAHGGGLAVRQRVHPSLLPVLVILSRLQVPLAEDPSGAPPALSTEAFLPPVRACANAASEHVRRLAAAALAPLVSPPALGGVCAELARALPGPGEALAPHNALHGRLLQLTALLAAAGGGDGAAPLSAADTAALVAAVAPQLERASWLGGAACACAPISVAYLAAARHALQLARACTAGGLAGSGRDGGSAHAAAAGLRAAVSRVCADTLAGGRGAAAAATAGPGAKAAHAGTDALRPMRCALLQQCAALWLGPLLPAPPPAAPRAAQGDRADAEAAAPEAAPSGAAQDAPPCASPSALLERLALASASTSYEARAAAYHATAQQLRGAWMEASTSAPANAVGSAAVERFLWGRLAGEAHAKVQLRLLEVLAAVQGWAPGAAARDGEWAPPWAALLRLLASPAARSGALLCLAHATRACAHEAARAAGRASPGLSEAVVQLVEQLEGCSAPWQPDASRAAAVAALAASGLLEALTADVHDRGDGAARSALAVRSWRVAVRLVEDDDCDVRAAAAAAVQAAVGRCGAGAAEPPSPISPLSTDAALRTAVAHLASCARVRPALLPCVVAALCGWVCDAAPSPPAIAADRQHAAGSVDGGVAGWLPQRLFDREGANFHHEPLLLAQLAAQQLRAMLPLQPAVCGGARGGDGGTDAAAVAVLNTWALGCISGLQAASQQVPANLSGHGCWGGGAANHASRFASLAHWALGVWAAAPQLRSDEALREAAATAAEAAKALLGGSLSRQMRMTLSAVEAASSLAALGADSAVVYGDLDDARGAAIGSPCFLVQQLVAPEHSWAPDGL